MPSSPSSCCSSEQHASVSSIHLTSGCPGVPDEPTEETTTTTAMATMIAVRSEPRRSRPSLPLNDGQTNESGESHPCLEFSCRKLYRGLRSSPKPRVCETEHVDDATSELPSRIDEYHDAVLASTHASSTRNRSRNNASAPATAIASAGGKQSGESRIGISASTSTSTETTQKIGNIVTSFTSVTCDRFRNQAKPSSTTAPMRGGPTDKHRKETRDIETDNEEPEEDSPSKKKMSVEKLTAEKKARKQRTPQSKAGQTNGRWTQQEHQAFLVGLKECGREWKKVAQRIPTRTSAQIRSHAQKYFSRVERDHDTNFVQDGSAQPSSGCGASPLGGDVTTSSLTPSVQRTVDTILANPAEAQRQVESTLDALRERYRQLQYRLQQRQLQRHTQLSSEHFSSPSRKRSSIDIRRPRIESFSLDDHSSVSSNYSASVASMGNDELIALSVLGGTLPRGESSPTVERMAVQTSGCSDDSIASSTVMEAHAEENHGNESSNRQDDDDDGNNDLSHKRSRRSG